jgi:peptidoglycan/LPS O-acetylase OafA/YrhL
VPELDGLRGLACILILAYHMMPHRLPGGWAAVDLFFVLSGFLITSIILRSVKEPRFLFNFCVRRGLRIWPIYYLSVLTIAICSPLLTRPTDFRGVLAQLTYGQNLPLLWSRETPEFSPYLKHTWSLAIEEQFYLVWPLLIYLLGRRSVLALSFGLIALSITTRSMGYHWWLLPARGDGLALGALLAVIPFTRAGRPRHAGGLRAGFVALAVAAIGYLAALTARFGMTPSETPVWPGISVFAVNLLAFSIVGLVVSLRGHLWLFPLRRPRLVLIGKLSYGLYMYHYIIFLLGDDIASAFGMGGRPFWRQALEAVVTAGLAAVSWRYLEQPILSLKSRFEYRPGETRERGRPHLAIESERPALAADL